MKMIAYIFGSIATVLFGILGVIKIKAVLVDGLTIRDAFFLLAVVVSIIILWYQLTKKVKKLVRNLSETEIVLLPNAAIFECSLGLTIRR